TQRGPTGSIPFGDVTGWAAAGRRKPAPRIEAAARYCQRSHGAVHPRAKRLPATPVPFGDSVCKDTASDSEAAADIDIARAIRRYGVDQVVRARNAAHADPVGVAEGGVNPHGIHS